MSEKVTLEQMGINNRLDVRCGAKRQYKGDFINEDHSGTLRDFYPTIEEPIRKILEVVSRRLEKDGDYLEFQIIIKPTFSGRTMREAAIMKDGEK